MAFDRIKADIAKATMHAVDESIPFQVESDASDFALAATLNQVGRPVAFFSRTLQGPEIRHSSVEKEAQAIVEAVRHWRHYLAGKRFTPAHRPTVRCLDVQQHAAGQNQE